MKTSEKYSLDLRDGLKGLLVAVLAAACDFAYTSLSNSDLSVNWSEMAKISILAGLAYLTKNFFTPAKRITDP